MEKKTIHKDQSAPVIALRDGGVIPQVGLGLWQVTDEQQFWTACETAMEYGYRHFDTAQIYKNEHLLGEFMNRSGYPRKDFFITTKIWPGSFGYKRTLRSFATSLAKLRTEYVDLLLLHYPIPFVRKPNWQALEKLYTDGKAQTIGVSNYSVRHLESMKNYARIMPSVNQVEVHIFLQQPELVEYCRQNDIVVEAYSPLAHAKIMNDEKIEKIAEKHHRSYAQIMLRWGVEQGLVVLPKSVSPNHIKENINIFDFSLSDDDKTGLRAADQNKRTLQGPNFIP